MDIGKGVSTDDLVKKINEHIQNKFKKDDIFSRIISSNPKSPIVYLNEYLFAKEKEVVVDFNISNVEVEHIMPSSGKNIAAIREDASMSEEEFAQYVNMLGNKILLEQKINSAIGRNWFMTKKQKTIKEKRGYKDSDFAIAQSLTEYHKDEWTKIDIDNATQKAAERIVDFIFGKKEN